MAKIIYTITDEAPALATASLLPVIERFAAAAGITVETRDISLAGRILAAFPEHLADEQRVSDALAELGALTRTPDANIIKLPNISASLPQLKAAIQELQAAGYTVPDHPDDPADTREADIVARYAAVKGSAVNPVLREGNSDRRAPAPVKNHARRHPHSMGAWSPDSRSHVATMSAGDFRQTERSLTLDDAQDVRIEHVAADGEVTVLRERIPTLAGEVIDAAVMRRRALVDFLEAQLDDAREQGLLFSVHLKATMMKVSDPIIFGHVVRTYFADLFARHAATLEVLGVRPSDGIGSLLSALDALPEAQRAPIVADLEAAYDAGPDLAQVDSSRGITNLHVPSDVIIDASMPAMIRSSGRMWNEDDELQDVKAVIPDSSYAPLYAETIRFCKEHGAFDPTTMGTVPNVGLMAQKAEEYGSHDKTFEITTDGLVRVVSATGATLLEHEVEAGDIWRMCQTKHAAVVDWVALAVARARATGMPAIFWLDRQRAHDAEIIAKVEAELTRLDTDGLDIQIHDVAEAARRTLLRTKAGHDTLSVTGNVLRDYLTDLFPILELGTSAKMLSIVPLMAGGGLFETGAGGSAPKHVQQFLRENHLRWDSLGEFLALAASLEHLAERSANPRARLLSECLDRATTTLLEKERSPARKVGELDNRGSHFYLALYWAQELAEQRQDPDMAARFAPLADELTREEERIVEELATVQGAPVDIGGYYRPDPTLLEQAMRPSTTFNAALELLGG